MSETIENLSRVESDEREERRQAALRAMTAERAIALLLTAHKRARACAGFTALSNQEREQRALSLRRAMRELEEAVQVAWQGEDDAGR